MQRRHLQQLGGYIECPMHRRNADSSCGRNGDEHSSHGLLLEYFGRRGKWNRERLTLRFFTVLRDRQNWIEFRTGYSGGPVGDSNCPPMIPATPNDDSVNSLMNL